MPHIKPNTNAKDMDGASRNHFFIKECARRTFTTSEMLPGLTRWSEPSLHRRNPLPGASTAPSG